MRSISIVFALVILLGWMGCSKDPVKTNGDINEVNKSLVSSNNNFGIDLLKALNTEQAEEPNIIISPLSVSMALGMTANGANGNTRNAMLTALRFSGLSISDANQTFRDILDNMPIIDPAVDVSIANSVWHDQNFAVKQTFLQLNQLYFDAQVQALDFTDPNAKDDINNWVSNNTNGKIPTIIDQIDPNNVMFLVNAVYFQANWSKAFDPRNTNNWPFYLQDGSTINTPLMYSKNMRYAYYEDNEVQVADIPYENGVFSMTVVLPEQGNNVQGIINGLTGSKWDSWMAALDTNYRPELYLPKMELDYNTSLKEALSVLGMDVAFDPNQSDFTNIADANLYITNVQHKTYFKVDEAGTEAAGATSVGVGVTSVPPTMFVNKPFLIAIRERETGSILFIGKVGNPAL